MCPRLDLPEDVNDSPSRTVRLRHGARAYEADAILLELLEDRLDQPLRRQIHDGPEVECT